MWGMLKDTMVETTGLTRDALHIHVGLLIMTLALWFLGTSRWFIVAWSAVLLAALGNEILDLRSSLHAERSHNWSDSVGDVINTMVWPTVLALFAARRAKDKTPSQE